MEERELNVRAYQESDIPGIQSLFLECFNKEMNDEIFRWKYLGSPWGSRGYVALCDGQVAGFYGGLQLAFRYQRRALTAYQFCDVMIGPRYRKRLFSKTPIVAMLGETFYRENPMDFAYGFPSIRHARLQALRLEGEGYRMVRLYRKAISGPAERSMMSVREGWERFDASASLPRPYEPFAFDKNGKYLAWRYRDNPSMKYIFLSFRKILSLKGIAVCEVSDRRLKIMDIFTSSDRDILSVLLALEQYALRNMDDPSEIVTWFHPDEPAAGYAADMGYCPEDALPLAFRPVNIESGVDAELFYGIYRYRMGDYDAG